MNLEDRLRTAFQDRADEVQPSPDALAFAPALLCAAAKSHAIPSAARVCPASKVHVGSGDARHCAHTTSRNLSCARLASPGDLASATSLSSSSHAWCRTRPMTCS